MIVGDRIESRAMLVLPSSLTHREAPDAARLLEEVLRAEMASAGAPSTEDIPIDASGLTQFDSSALAVLMECRRHAAAAGRGIVLRHGPPKLHQLARLYGLDELLGVAASAMPAAFDR